MSDSFKNYFLPRSKETINEQKTQFLTQCAKPKSHFQKISKYFARKPDVNLNTNIKFAPIAPKSNVESRKAVKKPLDRAARKPDLETSPRDKGHYLFIDVETTGLDLQCDKLLSVGWCMFDASGQEIGEKYFVLKQNPGFDINHYPENQAIHGLKNEDFENGTTWEIMAKHLCDDLASCSFIGNHNLPFDSRFILKKDSEEKTNIEALWMNKVHYDTKRLGIRLFNYFGKNDPTEESIKTISLEELFFSLFGENLLFYHHPTHDARNSARCFFKMKELELDIEEFNRKNLSNKIKTNPGKLNNTSWMFKRS